MIILSIFLRGQEKVADSSRHKKYTTSFLEKIIIIICEKNIYLNEPCESVYMCETVRERLFRMTMWKMEDKEGEGVISPSKCCTSPGKSDPRSFFTYGRSVAGLPFWNCFDVWPVFNTKKFTAVGKLSYIFSFNFCKILFQITLIQNYIYYCMAAVLWIVMVKFEIRIRQPWSEYNTYKKGCSFFDDLSFLKKSWKKKNFNSLSLELNEQIWILRFSI